MPGDWRGRWRRVLLLVLIDRAHRGLEIAFEDESISYGFQLYSFLLVHHQLKAIPIYYSGTTLQDSAFHFKANSIRDLCRVFPCAILERLLL